MNACTTVGSVWPTFSVPGMIRSGTILKNRNDAGVVAKDPMPSVSKKLVIAPTPRDNGVGGPTTVAGDGAAPRTATPGFGQPATNTAVSPARAAGSPGMGV